MSTTTATDAFTPTGIEKSLTIWKFPISITDAFALEMPACATILSFQIQQGLPCIWALVDKHKLPEMRDFRIYGTGHPIASIENHRYIGTAMDGSFVWHLFEKL